MQEADIRIALSGDEALILFEWLSSFNERTETPYPERQVLANVEAMLEKHLVTPFLPTYFDELDAARARFSAEFDLPDVSGSE
jgi:hypothetical protein